MLKMIALATALLMTTGCKLSKGSKLASVHVGDISALKDHGCIDKAKKEMQTVASPDLGDDAAVLNEFAQLFTSAAQDIKQFSREKNSNVLNTLKVDDYLTQGPLAVRVQNTTTATAAAGNSASSGAYLLQHVTFDFVRDGLLVATVRQTSRVAGDTACTKTLLSQTADTFTLNPDQTYHVISKETNRVTGNVVKTKMATVHQEFLQGKALVDTLPPVAPKVTTETVFKVYGSPDMPEVSATATPVADVMSSDLITGEAATFHQVHLVFDVSGAMITLAQSPLSEYATSTDKSADSFGETVNKALFDQAELSSLYVPPNAGLNIVGFSFGDFDNSALSYVAGFGGPWTYDNYTQYASVSPIDASTWPKDQTVPTAPYLFQITNTPSLHQWDALATIAFADTIAAGHAAVDQSYLKSTTNIDFQDPSFAPIISSLQADLAASPDKSTLNAVKVLLAKTNSLISYDSGALNSNTVQVIKASIALAAKKGVCQHYAAIFSALARGLGIPARVIYGYKLADDPSGTQTAGGHAWVEVQIGNQWIPFEPESTDLKAIDQTYLPWGVDFLYEDTSPDLSKAKAKELDLMLTNAFILKRAQP